MTAASPRFSVLLTDRAEQRELVTTTVESVVAQSFPDWELIVVGAGAGVPAGDDARLRSLDAAPGRGMAASGNRALAAALGTFVVVLEAGDTLHRDALAHLARAVGASPTVDVAYTDTDVPAPGDHGGREVVRKPAWSPERLRHGDYIGPFRVMRTSLVREVGGYRGEAATGYDLTLRVTERAREVVHLGKVLCHRRRRPVPPDGTAARKAAQDQLDRLGIAATVSPGPVPGYHRVTRALDPDLAISIIVPTRGQVGEHAGRSRYFVVEAVRAALARTAHRNVEVVVVYDDTTPAEVLPALREIAGDRLVCVPYDKPFNFSEKCNLGFLHCGGDVVVLLNDDTEAVSENWLEALVAPLSDPDVGMTGARLLYADGTVQHGGHLYASGAGGKPGPWNAYRWSASDDPGDFGSLVVTRECSGVTAACAALRRDVYVRVGGLSESLPENFNDVDLSLKVRHVGLRVLWVADCELVHFETQTRTPTVQPYEYQLLADRWAGSFAGDPYLPWLRLEDAKRKPVRT